MEDFLSMMLEFLGDLLENALRRIRNLKIRKWALTIFYFIITSLFTAALLLLTVTAYRECSNVAVLILSAFTALWFLGSGFFIIRHHKKQ